MPIATAAELEQRLSNILAICAVTVRPCRLCGAELHLLRSQTGKLVPIDSDGFIHFANCPKWRPEHQRAGVDQLQQEKLFDTRPLPD